MEESTECQREQTHIQEVGSHHEQLSILSMYTTGGIPILNVRVALQGYVRYGVGRRTKYQQTHRRFNRHTANTIGVVIDVFIYYIRIYENNIIIIRG